MGFANRAIVAAGVGFAASALVGCGGSNGSLLSQDQASALSYQLQQASYALNDGECDAAADAIQNFTTSVGQLGSVNSALVRNLNQGATRIANLASQECSTAQHTYTAPPPKTRTDTTPTVTTTDTITTPVTTTTTTPTTDTIPTTTDTIPTTTDTIPTTTDTIPTTTDTIPTTTTATTTTPNTGGSGFGTTSPITSTPPGFTGGQGTS